MQNPTAPTSYQPAQKTKEELAIEIRGNLAAVDREKLAPMPTVASGSAAEKSLGLFAKFGLGPKLRAAKTKLFSFGVKNPVLYGLGIVSGTLTGGAIPLAYKVISRSVTGVKNIVKSHSGRNQKPLEGHTAYPVTATLVDEAPTPTQEPSRSATELSQLIDATESNYLLSRKEREKKLVELKEELALKRGAAPKISSKSPQSEDLSGAISVKNDGGKLIYTFADGRTVEKATPESSRDKIKGPESFKDRAGANFEKLKGMGLKGLDAYRNLPPKYKIAAGVAFAGASLVTGGATTVVTRGIAMAASSRGFFESEMKKLKDAHGSNISDKQIRIAGLKSVMLGALIGFGAPAAFQNAGEMMQAVGLGSVSDFVKEKAGDAVVAVSDSSKTFVNYLKDKLPNITPGTVDSEVSNNEFSAVTGAATQASTPTPTETLSAESLSITELATLPAEAPLPAAAMESYEIQKGDNLEKVLMSELAFDSADNLTDIQKRNIIYNLLASDAGKAVLAESGITDINKIQLGQKIDIDKLSDLIYGNDVALDGDDDGVKLEAPVMQKTELATGEKKNFSLFERAKQLFTRGK